MSQLPLTQHTLDMEIGDIFTTRRGIFIRVKANEHSRPSANITSNAIRAVNLDTGGIVYISSPCEILEIDLGIIKSQYWDKTGATI